MFHDELLDDAVDADDDEEEDGKMRPRIIPSVNIPTIPTIISRGESDIMDDHAKNERNNFLFLFPSFSSAVVLSMLSMLSLSSLLLLLP